MSKTFKSEGIIFRSLKYSETSLILDIYSKDIGLHSYIVSGVRKSKSKSVNVYNPMQIIEYVAYKSEDKLSRIKEGKISYLYSSIPFDVIKSSIAMYMVDISRSAIKEKESNLHLYNFIKSSLVELDNRSSNLGNLPLIFSLNLCSYLGFGISNNYSENQNYFDLRSGQFTSLGTEKDGCLDEIDSQHLFKILNNPNVPLSKGIRSNLTDHIMMYYKMHVEGFKELKSLPIMRTILS